MQGIVTTRRHVAVNVDQILHAAHFCAEDNLVAPQSVFFRHSAEFSALTTMASIVTSRASFGSAEREFSSIMRVSNAGQAIPS